MYEPFRKKMENQDKREAARILDDLGVRIGEVHIILHGLITVHNFNNNKTSIVITRTGEIIDRYRTPDRGKFLEDRNRRTFLYIG